MFKKLKDKLAEEVKSSPQRIQQFAQAAQAAVTSASSSISDITNSDLFSIGDNDTQSSRTLKPSSSSQANTFQEVSLVQPATMQSGSETADFFSQPEENQRQRRLSNSSFASDVSFRLPSYESPSMYHLQSDMEVSASEAEERAISSGSVSLDRVTKEQLYTAYRRTQDKYTKYRTQYADLARHYKLLERENAKARSVLVETQDKALRRISELREQCTLEQSAKAHLEKALRVDIEEKNMKIEALETKISILQNGNPNYHVNRSDSSSKTDEKEGEVQLINLSGDNDNKANNTDTTMSNDILATNSKLEKMEQLLNKYKESLKTAKEKNSQISTEIKLLANDLKNKSKENEDLKKTCADLAEAQQKIEDLNNLNEELHNKINTYDFNKTKEVSTLETDLQKCYEEIAHLRSKVEVFSKREEEYAISLAENKLSIHKELESKETEIKSLKDNLGSANNELQSLNIILTDYKTSVTNLEEEKLKLIKELKEKTKSQAKVKEMETLIQELLEKCTTLEQMNNKSEEEYKVLDLQMTQETAEKMAIIDRNSYLEDKILKVTEDNSKRNKKLLKIESELQSLRIKQKQTKDQSEEVELWKSKFSSLETEIQEEREELIKLQTEIEILLANHELAQQQNIQLNNEVSTLKEEIKMWHQKVGKVQDRTVWEKLLTRVKELQNDIKLISKETISFKKQVNDEIISEIKTNLLAFSEFSEVAANMCNKYEKLEKDYLSLQNDSKNVKEKHDDNSQEFMILQSENNELNKQIQSNAADIEKSKQEIQILTDKYTRALDEINVFKNENQKLVTKIQEFEILCNRLQDSVDHDKTQYLAALDKLKVLDDEKQTLQKRKNNIEKENESLNIDLEKLKVQHNEETLRYNTIIIKKQDEINEKDLTISRLEQTSQLLSQENISLKKQCDSIANSLKDLELEINEVRKSHAKIETEKDRLNSIIEELDKRENEKSNLSIASNKEVQTELDNHIKKSEIEDINDENDGKIMNLSGNIDLLCATNSDHDQEMKFLKESNIDLQSKLQEMNELKLKNESLQDQAEKSHNLSNEHDLLKEENRRLKSDIEGLQTYLTKISKENGVLNDKIRELIASSENIERSEFHESEIKNDGMLSKEKIEDLVRENNLLIEENLELKDQLQSQTYDKPKELSNNNDGDSVPLDKYNNLLINKNKLEERMTDLEQMNKSINGNMQQIQVNNEKLRLTNEKLERRLDEALVSLRHLHSLQENTELEYLRNILFEYLTGTGTHSITLAKVLAAVVKFDDKQTQQVLQKEKERQGLLRQLGIM